MDIIVEFFRALFAMGPIGILIAVGFAGWGVAGYILYSNWKKKDAAYKLRDSFAKDVKRIQDINLDKVNAIHDEYRRQMLELSDKHNNIMLILADKRVVDIKDLTDDYAELAANTLKTLDRLIYQIEARKASKNREG